MGAEDQIVISLSGEGPWGFRLHGGSEKKLPLQVSKVRKRSKACRGGLWEKDELVSINGKSCVGISHATAMQLIDSSGGRLQICVKRTPAVAAGEQRTRMSPTPSPGGQPQRHRQLRPLTPPTSPDRPHLLHRESITSPPDSEAYYGETDSDADTLGQRTQEPTPAPQEKHRRARKKSPRSPPEPQSMSEMSGYDSAPEPARQLQHQQEEEGAPQSFQHYAPWRSGGQQQDRPIADSAQNGTTAGGVAKREIVYQPSGDSRAETPFSDVEGFFPAEEEEGPAPSPEAMMLPQGLGRCIRAERPLIPMVGPVDHPVDEDLTTSYAEKAKQAMLHRSESVQDKQVKEAKTKCRTIASLLTDAPNPHSKGVLMFKKRRQRAKKYTLISYGSVDEDRTEDEDGIFPTSESEFDEEGFSDARSLTNHSDWDNSYLDIEKPKMELQPQREEQGLSEASGRGAKMFEQQRQKAAHASMEQVPHQTPERHQPQPDVPVTHMMMNGEGSAPQSPSWSQVSGAEASQASTDTAALFNRSARPFTPGVAGHRPATTSVIFRPSTPKKKVESPSVRSIVPSPFAVSSPVAGTVSSGTQMAPSSANASLYVPASPKTTAPLTTKLSVEEIALESTPAPTVARTTTASIYLSSPSRPAGSQSAVNQPTTVRPHESAPVTPGTSSTSLFISPSPAAKMPNPTTGSMPCTSVPQSPINPIASYKPTSESMASREQRIAVPASRTGILQEARKRGTRKQMFNKVEEKQKNSPNPELLSLVQNLDVKPKHDPSGAGFESGPEEDFLSLGAEACNFMQSPKRKFKTPPPVAPKPHPGNELVNGTQDMPQLRGRGAELFAKRQSRMDKFVVESTPAPSSRPRTPSPTPSLPTCWKYSSNIRAPPPIGYNPLLSPFYPLAASRSLASKVESKVNKAPSRKPRMQAIDFMKHQPYQLNSAMFCYGGSSSAPVQNPAGQVNQKSNLSVTPARQVPVKTVRAYEIKRFSTPTPMSSSTSLAPVVIKPRSATTLDEPIWRTEVTSPPVPSSTPAPLASYAPAQQPQPYKTSPEYRPVGVYSVSSPITSPQSSVSGIQVARPRFSTARTGIQANVWRPASVHY